MTIRIVPHEERWRTEVEAFNERMQAGGSKWGFYRDPVPDWIPKRDGQSVWREYHLAVEDEQLVRGGFALKPQDWLIDGQRHVVTDWQGPFTEGAYDSRFAALGLRIVREMLKMRPLLYSWGHGGEDEPIVKMLRTMGWLMHETPFLLRVVKPFRFLRHNRHLRSSPRRRLALDLAAFSGAGAAGLRALSAAQRLRHGRRFAATGEVVDSFGGWADELWDAVQGEYRAIAVRDAAAMNALIPAVGWPPAIRLRVHSAGRSVGWAAVLDSSMRDDPRFGSLRVGSIVDCLARPADAGLVVAAAWRFLRDRGVDLVVSNQAHPDWVSGFAANGFTIVPNRRIFAASPQLAAHLAPIEEVGRGLHLTNMDGHGPMAL